MIHSGKQSSKFCMSSGLGPQPSMGEPPWENARRWQASFWPGLSFCPADSLHCTQGCSGLCLCPTIFTFLFTSLCFSPAWSTLETLPSLPFCFFVQATEKGSRTPSTVLTCVGWIPKSRKTALKQICILYSLHNSEMKYKNFFSIFRSYQLYWKLRNKNIEIWKCVELNTFNFVSI